MSMMDIIAQLRERIKKRNKSLPWYCLLRKEDSRCIHLDLDCAKCEIYEQYRKGEEVR